MNSGEGNNKSRQKRHDPDRSPREARGRRDKLYRAPTRTKDDRAGRLSRIATDPAPPLAKACPLPIIVPLTESQGLQRAPFLGGGWEFE